MTTQIAMEDRQERRSGLGIHLAMTTISLAVVGAFVLWHTWPEGGQRSELTASEVAVSTTSEETMPQGGLAELDGEQEAAARTMTEWMYIVESEAHEQALFATRALLTDADVDLWSPTSSNVIWFDSEESERRFWQIQGEGDAVRDHLGLPRLTIVDLRGSAQTATLKAGAGPASACDQAVHEADC
ncbi:MAG: hypothetical protein AB7R89_07575 [Dehalococcoidia bacterium]